MSDVHSVRADLFDAVVNERLVAGIPSLVEWERMVADVLRLDGCGGCGGSVLVDVGSGRCLCSARCGWTGVVLRRLP